MKRFIALCLLVPWHAVVAKDFDLSDLLHLLNDQSKKIESIDRLLDYIPDEYNHNHTELYNSRSEFPASPKYPRVIAYGRSGKLILSYRGDPANKAAYSSLQVMRFVEEPRPHRELYSITFPPARDAQGNVVEPEKNPAECVSCHGNPPRAKWDAYFFWPGAFGSEDDEVAARENGEAGLRQQFLQGGNKTDRYKHLGDQEVQDSTLVGFSKEHPDPRGATGANLKLGRILTYQKVREITSELGSNAGLYPYRYAVLGALFCGSQYDIFGFKPLAMEAFLPPELPGARPLKSPESLMTAMRAVNQNAFQLKMQRHLALIGNSRPESGRVGDLLAPGGADSLIGEPHDTLEIVARLRSILEPLGMNAARWSLEAVPSYNYNDGSGGFIGGLQTFGWKTLLNKSADPDLYEIFHKASTGIDSYDFQFFDISKATDPSEIGDAELNARTKACGLLEKKSLDTLREYAKTFDRHRPSSGQAASH